MPHFCMPYPCLICNPKPVTEWSGHYQYSPPAAEVICGSCARKFVVKVEYGEPIDTTCNACKRDAQQKQNGATNARD